MSNIRSEFGNLKGHQVETARNTIVINNTYYGREARGIQDGVRKDKNLISFCIFF